MSDRRWSKDKERRTWVRSVKDLLRMGGNMVNLTLNWTPEGVQDI